MNAIKFYRLKKDWLQSDLAEAMGLSKQAISNYETGKTVPSVGRYKRLAIVLGLEDWTDLTKEI